MQGYIYNTSGFINCCTHLYLWVLVSSHCSEGRLWEGEGLKWAPTDSVRTVCLGNMKPGVVAVHRVQDDLMGFKKKRVGVSTHIYTQ